MSVELHGPEWAWALVVFWLFALGPFVGGYCYAALMDFAKWLRSATGR